VELWRLAAHRHWFTVRLLGRELRLCSRCSGYVSGIIALSLLQRLQGPSLRGLSAPIQVLLCLALILPSAVDWLTQSWGLRESSNRMRLLTGALLGAGTVLFFSIDAVASMRAILYALTALVIVLLGYAGKWF